MQVAIVGAGFAGITAARYLAEAGYFVTVYDKSKGTGGRLSSRHVDSGWIDHGAPFFSSESPVFRKFLERFVPAGSYRKWSPTIRGEVNNEEKTGLVGVPRNSAITRALLGDIRFQPSTRIARLIIQPSGWQLENDGGSIVGSAEIVIVAVPSPQALTLVRQFPHVFTVVRESHMEPCWVTAVQTSSALSDWTDVSVHDHPVIKKTVLNSAKPGRNNQNVYTLYANKNWSESHLEETADWVGQQMKSAFEEIVPGSSQSTTLFTHRWRYAFASAPLDRACLWDDQIKLGICGDWFLGRRVEDAWSSAEALAHEVMQADTKP